MSTSPNIEIRDLRQQDWIWTHKAVLFHDAIDASGFKVYCGLASYANNHTQKAFPSINTLAKRLHLNRTTVMRVLGKLEQIGIIQCEKTEGKHNIYYLLEVGIVASGPAIEFAGGGSAVITPIETPREEAERFFNGIESLMKKEECEWLSMWLREFSTKYDVEKKAVWDQVRSFGMYWTEKNPTGLRERWQMEKTFMVGRRLETWFKRARIQAKAQQAGKSKGRAIIKSTP